MKKQIVLFPLLLSCIIFSGFIFSGVNVIFRYSDNKTDWHYTAALFGSICFGLLLTISLAGFVVTRLKANKEKIHIPIKLGGHN